MDRVTELRIRERRLRAKVRSSASSDGATSRSDRQWIARELATMEAIFDEYLAEVPADEWEYERYRLEFELPAFSYLRRTYGIFYPEAVTDTACVR